MKWATAAKPEWQRASRGDGFLSLAFPPGEKKKLLVKGLKEKIKVQVVRLAEGSSHQPRKDGPRPSPVLRIHTHPLPPCSLLWGALGRESTHGLRLELQ